ncbi:flagellar basal body rod protein FlgB [Burkholderia gladioli]|uniref:flagellar basal body rod protein FlgB n=1 Tax=Burkholderia gladioli TaxID=28095 RepID=UPI001641F709|nr:flagellar basal body rod protein FlgB [Burkholderia gladioli]
MLDKLDAEFAFGRQALDVRAYRQELLSSNIANADTPGYQARDVDFGATLGRALKQQAGQTTTDNATRLPLAQPAGVTSGMTLVSTAPGHMSGDTRLAATGGPVEDYGRAAYRIPSQPSLDGNTVDLDAERVQFADNTVHFETGMTLVSGQIKAMLAAIQSGS